MDALFVCEKELMENVINCLKTLDVRGYDSYEKLVGCVSVLRNAMKNKVKGTPKDSDAKGENTNNGGQTDS